MEWSEIAEQVEIVTPPPPMDYGKEFNDCNVALEVIEAE
jgi:hypothetical protein